MMNQHREPLARDKIDRTHQAADELDHRIFRSCAEVRAGD